MYRYSLCEVFARKLLPSIKLYIAYKLVKEYSYSQLRVSSMLGVKQPLINYVLSGRRKPRFIDYITNCSDLRKTLDSIVDKLVRDSLDEKNICLTCYICRELKESNLIETVLKQIGYSTSEVYIPS